MTLSQCEILTAPDQQPGGREIRYALVVEGGGLRGAFCAGVLEALHHLAPNPPSHVYATSAGAPSAAYLATGQINLAIRLWETRTHASHLVSPRHWLKGRPLMDIDKLVDTFRGRLALDVEQFGRSPTKVFIAVTNCRTASVDYLRLNPDNALDVLTATMALPLAYGRIVNVHGQPYIDGGVTSSIPLEPALDRDVDEIVVVLTRPEGYRKKRSKLAEAMLRAQYGRYPDLMNAFRARSDNYNQCLDLLMELQRQGRVRVIRPDEPLPASRMTRDRKRILETIQIGRDTGRRWLAEGGLSGARIIP
jgi:predicted patatin/cPLA2 family phospholipase